MKTSPDPRPWVCRINRQTPPGPYPWQPCTEEEGLMIQRQGYMVLPSGIKMMAVAQPLENCNDLA